MENEDNVRGLEDGITITEDVLSRLISKKLPTKDFKSQLALELEYLRRKAQGKKLESVIWMLEDF